MNDQQGAAVENSDNPQSRCTLVFTGNRPGSTLFHLGSLWCLNELGWLQRTDRIICASGGSLLAAHLALNWHQLKFNEAGIAGNFAELVARPILDAFDNLPVTPPDSLGLVKELERKQLLHLCQSLLGITSTDALPVPVGAPEFVFYCRSHPQGNHVRITRNRLIESGVGFLHNPHLPLSTVVIASCAHPPLFNPERVTLENSRWYPHSSTDAFHESRYRSSLLLTGGCLCGQDQLDVLPALSGQTFVSDAEGKYGFMASLPAKERRLREQAPPPLVPPADYLDRNRNRTFNSTLRAYWSMAEEVGKEIAVPELLTALTANRRWHPSRSEVDKGFRLADQALPDPRKTYH